MADLMKDAFKFGLGAIDLAREESEKLADKLQKPYAKETAEGRKLVEQAIRDAKTQSMRLHGKIKAAVKDAVRKQELVAQKDIKDLTATIEKLGKLTQKIAKEAAANAKKKMKATAKKKTVKKSVNAKPAKTKAKSKAKKK